MLSKGGEGQELFGSNVVTTKRASRFALRSIRQSCRRQPTMICLACGKDSQIDFRFCPECGKLVLDSDATKELASSAAPQLTIVVPKDQSTPESIQTDVTKISAPTFVFAGFAILSLIVSIMKGIVPIYFLEALGWAGLALYWHRKQIHSELAKGIAFTLAAVLVVGETVQIASQAGSKSKGDSSNAATVYPGEVSLSRDAVSPQPTPVMDSKPDVAPPPPIARSRTSDPQVSQTTTKKISPEDVRRRALDLYRDSRYQQAAPLLDQSCQNGYAYACEILGRVNTNWVWVIL
jgi:hypothetical protein